VAIEDVDKFELLLGPQTLRFGALGLGLRALGLVFRPLGFRFRHLRGRDGLAPLALGAPGLPGGDHRHRGEPREGDDAQAEALAVRLFSRLQRLAALVLRLRHLLDLPPRCIAACDLRDLALLDEIEMQRGRLGRILGAPGRPCLGLGHVGARQQAIGRPSASLPLRRALEEARVLAQPVEVGVERVHQPRQARAEARARRFGLGVEENVVEVPQTLGRFRPVQRPAIDRDDALVEPLGLAHLPLANLRLCRVRRQHEHDRVGLADHGAEPLLPGLAAGYAFPVERRLEAAQLQPRGELVGEIEVLATVGDEDAKFLGSATARHNCALRRSPRR
jgi:hypothetical protein